MKTAQMMYPLFVLIFFCGIISESLAIWCYTCNSYEDSRCNNPDNKTMAKVASECPSDVKMCRKIEQIFEIDGEEVTRIHRDCAKRGDLGDCLERTGTNKFKSWYCNCENEDLCNKATITTSSTAMTGAIVASLYFIRRLL